jgi:signal transduction histidine kinase
MAAYSIRTRVIAAVVASQLLLAAALVLVGVSYTKRRLESALDATLHGRAMTAAALVRYDEDNTSHLIFDRSLLAPPLDGRHPDLYRVVVNGDGLLAQSAGWPAGMQPPNGQPHWDFMLAGVPYRAIGLQNVPILDREGPSLEPAPTLSIIYAVPAGQVRAEVAGAAVYLALAGLATLCVTVLLALWGVRRGLLPLERLAGHAAGVSTRSWELPENASAQPQELVPLVQAMKTMLGGLRQAFTQQHEFLGNAAHELKTPVATLKSTLQSVLQKPRSAEDYRAGMEQALEDLARLEKLLQWMLRLARAEQWAAGALRRDLEPVNVTDTCQEAIARLRGLAQSRAVIVNFSGNGPARLHADPEDLQLIWTNLLENAVRHTPEHRQVTVCVERVDGRARVTVADQGAGIPEADLEHIFERFYRGDVSRARDTGGFGLGLAIAKALTEAYGGSIHASSNTGKGTCMVVELPLS